MRQFTLALAALAFTGSAALAQQQLRIGTEGAYPPFNYLNEANELVGFEIDLGNAICERAQITCEWVLNDWDTIIPNLVAGNYDAIMAGMNATEARAEVIAFSAAYKRPDPSLYVGLDGVSEDVITSGVIAAQSNTIQASIVADTDATLIEFPTPDETIAAVRSGVADAVLADGEFLRTYVNDSNGELVIIGSAMPPGEGISIGLRQSDTALNEQLSAVLMEMRADGSLNALLVQWFGNEVVQF